MENMEHERARCPYCYRDVEVTKIDTLKTHRDAGERCTGSGILAFGYFHG